MPVKRKTPPGSAGYSDPAGKAPNKRSTTSRPARKASADGTKPESGCSRTERCTGIVQRAFYPPEMPNERCRRYNDGEIPRPMEVLEKAVAETKERRASIGVSEAVVHWFKRDLRMSDNRGLSLAVEKAREGGVTLVCVFVVSPQDYQAHFTSAARVDFELRTLAVLKRDLAELDIPLLVETVDGRKDVVPFLIGKCRQWHANHLFCNIEYEVDELRRETRLTKECLEAGIDFTAVHDDVVVPPGALRTGQGKQYAVYSPWFRAWLAHLEQHPHLLDESPKPDRNPKVARKKFADIFESDIPPTPDNKRLDPAVQERLASIWPAGEHEARERLGKFIKQSIGKYTDTRNFPAANSTAMVSVHHSAGTLAARTSVRLARDGNTTKKPKGGKPGIAGWIGEVAWRDFYKHVLVHWPYVCMYKPFKYEYSNVEWEYNDEHFSAWCDGRTGVPIVDAAMRQLNHTAYMHNRCRMIVASFLAKDLLLDWRLGERYFMERLVDGDFASNNGGWGFAASVGVDPQPYFRIFNPLLQSEKFDPDGEYIRKWIPELGSVEGKAIHDPYGRGAEAIAVENAYPRPIVDHKPCRERALARYKEGIGRETA